MSTEFNFLVVDANQLVERQQAVVRELVAQQLDLASFRRAERVPAPPSADLRKKAKTEEPVR